MTNICDWTTLAGSQFSAETTGGALMVQMTVPVMGSDGPRNVTCAPFVDDQWAGTFAQMPGWKDPTPFWREGLLQTNGGWYQWRTARIYRIGPEKTLHEFEVRCAASETGVLLVNNPAPVVNAPDPNGELSSYISVLEVK